jgi:drug/metabolite transporter (DMT)-like permease
MRGRFGLERSGLMIPLLYLGCTLIWGCSFILMKIGLKTFSPDEVASLRLTFGGLCLLPVAIPFLMKNGWRHYPWGRLGLSALMGNVIPAFLFASAQQHLKSATGGVLNSLTPIFTLLVGALFFGVPITMYKTLGVMMGLAGAVTILLLRAGGQLTEATPEYGLLMVGATILYGFNGNYVRERLFHLRPLELVSLAFLAGSIPSSLYLISTPFLAKITRHPDGWTSFWAVMALGCLGTALASYLFWKMVEYSSVLFAATVTYCIPIVAVVLGYFGNDEAITIGHWLGMATILFGVWLTNRKKRAASA